MPNIPLLCETRWSEKYKSIRLFSSNFISIKEALSLLTCDVDVNQVTRSHASQLDSATSSVMFIVCLKIVSSYSSYLEPVANKLQAVGNDLHSVHKYLRNDLLGVFEKHREQSEEEFADIFREVKVICEQLDVDIKIPRRVGKQTHRSNVETSSPSDYFRISIYIPYLDSLITLIKTGLLTATKHHSKQVYCILYH